MDNRTVDYVAISNIIIATVITTSGEIKEEIIGGATTYAAAGMRIWSDRVGVSSGVGADFEDGFGHWFDAADIDKRGLFTSTDLTPRGLQDYANGEIRVESSQLGMEHFALHEPYPDDIPLDYFNVRGVYVFRDDRMNFWEPMSAVRSEKEFTLMWELAANAAHPDHWRQIAGILADVDLFSLNYEESNSLFPGIDLDEVVERLLSAGPAAVAIRMGAKGALVADRHEKHFIPPVSTRLVDYTGAGNAFCGGFLAGYCESTGSVSSAGICGAVSASFALEQFGPPDIDTTLLHAARCRAADYHSMEIDSWPKPSTLSELCDITDQVKEAVQSSGVQQGLCTITTPHTTAGLTITSYHDHAGFEDLIDEFSRLISTRIDFKHQWGTPTDPPPNPAPSPNPPKYPRYFRSPPTGAQDRR